MFRAAPIKVWPVSHLQDRSGQNVNVRMRALRQILSRPFLQSA